MSRADKDFLVVVAAPSEDELGRRYPLGEDVTTIGRDRDNDIVPNDDSVSRHHASIRRVARYQDEVIVWHDYVVTVDSPDGAFINEQRVLQPHEIRNRDQLRIGDTLLQLVAGCDLEHQYHAIIFEITKLKLDPITGLIPKRMLDTFLKKEIPRFMRRGQPLSMAMIDVDHFGEINEKYGSLGGDSVLRALAAIVEESSDPDHEVARYRNDELCVAFPDTVLEAAAKLSEALRERIERHVFMVAGKAIRITTSIGVAQLTEGMDVEGFYASATEMLDQAKRAGGNRIA